MADEGAAPCICERCGKKIGSEYAVITTDDPMHGDGPYHSHCADHVLEARASEPVEGG